MKFKEPFEFREESLNKILRIIKQEYQKEIDSFLAINSNYIRMELRKELAPIIKEELKKDLAYQVAKDNHNKFFILLQYMAEKHKIEIDLQDFLIFESKYLIKVNELDRGITCQTN